MRISDLSSDVCSSDLDHSLTQKQIGRARQVARVRIHERSHGDESAGDQNGPQQIQRVQRHQPDGKSCNRGERYNSLIKDELVIPMPTADRRPNAPKLCSDRSTRMTAAPTAKVMISDRKSTRLNSSH